MMFRNKPTVITTMTPLVRRRLRAVIATPSNPQLPQLQQLTSTFSVIPALPGVGRKHDRCVGGFIGRNKYYGLMGTTRVSRPMSSSTSSSTTSSTVPQSEKSISNNNTSVGVIKNNQKEEHTTTKKKENDSNDNDTDKEFKVTMKLSPDVPLGVQTVELPIQYRRSVVAKFLRSVSVDVNFDYRAWRSHQSIYRNLEIWRPDVLLGNSDLKRIIFPDVFTTGLVASFVTYFNHVKANDVWLLLDTNKDGVVCMNELKAGIDAGLVEANHIMGTDFFTTPDMLFLPTEPFTMTTMALGMMLAFRSQNCNVRFKEARATWGELINESRAFSSRIMALGGAYSGPEGEKVATAATHIVKLIMTFARTLKYHVTTDGHCPDISFSRTMTDAEVNEIKGEAIRQELFHSVWDYKNPNEREYVERLLDPAIGNRPLHALQEMSEITVQVLMKSKQEGGAGMHPQHVESIHSSITRLQDILGCCERLYKTPIYTGATRFTSRCTWVWTNSIPLCLYPIMGPMGTIPASMIIAMFMFGLEDIGARTEQPFGALPLWQYCDGIDSVCKQVMTQHEHLKSLPREW